MKKTFLTSGLSPALALLLALGWVAGATAKDAPKVKVSDREVNRTAPGASYAPVIKRVTPSVVTIQSTRTIVQRQNPFFDEEMLRRFFGDNFRSERGRPRRQTEQSLGSGIIVSEDGYILTNNHVVDGADADGVKVALSDGKTKYDAKVVGKDPRTDVAVLKIDAKNLAAITLADSDKLEVGDVVLAIGNPFNVGQSVTMGIVSALGRGDLPFGRMAEYEDFIQTDAAINPGNSGGALVDVEGRLIGINQSIVSRSGGNAGVGFAIPINLARSVLESITTDGKISRGYLGITLQPEITPELVQDFHLPDANGALVTEVMPDTPAARAGILRDDFIIEFNGKKIIDRRHLRLMVSQAAPQSKVAVKVLRNGREKLLTVTLGVQPPELGGEPTVESGARADSKTEQLDGVEVVDLDNQARRHYDIPARVKGALVAKVDPDSKAAEAGLREGDVIVEINRQPVANAEQAVELANKAKGDRVLLRVFSQENGLGTTRYLNVEAAKKK
jgi:serine protease Do